MMNVARLLLIAIPATMCFLAHVAADVRIPSDSFAQAASEHGNHSADDHKQELELLDASRASHTAVRSGDWLDPDIWSPGLPTAGARVVIPQAVTVTVKGSVGVSALDWVRIEGQLHFPETENSQLSATTIFVASGGTLSVGSSDRSVDPGKTVQLLFLPRSTPVRELDRFDILGGLIALGRVVIYGAPKAAFATPSTALQVGVGRLVFPMAPTGWRVGDELLFPASILASKDERRRIASISNGGTAITLSSPLEFVHMPPLGVPSEVPVGNLTRNVILASSETAALHERAHVIVMTREPVHISGAAFYGLGRTTADQPHTLPTVNDRGDVSVGQNPIGRYAVHFHIVAGASRRTPPHIFRDNVIVDSPKHGLVNHGGYVVAEDNVTFAIQGSHFFAENGSEIGAFRHNFAVFSRGSGEHIEGRQAGIGDFGHGGHGFWSNSPAVVIENNYAFHHAGPAYVIFAAPIEAADGAQNVFFRGGTRIENFLQENLESPLREMVTAKQVTPTTIPFRFSGNVAANSGRGLEIWHTNEVSEHDVQSIVERSVFWDTRSAGIAITYGVNTVVRNTIILGANPIACADMSTRSGRESECAYSVGISTEGSTRRLHIENVRIAGFLNGILVPDRGITTVSNNYLANKFNIVINPPHQPGRKTVIAGNRFERHENGGEDYHFVSEGLLFQGDISMLFERDPLIVEDERFPGKKLYWRNQSPSAVPFRHTGISELDEKTAAQIQREYGLAVGGVLAPDDVTEVPGIGGLVGGPPSHIAEMADEEAMIAITERLQAGKGEQYTSHEREGYGTDCCNVHRLIKGKAGERTGWRFLSERRGDKVATRLTYIDTSSPRFDLDPRIKLEIHPDDVRYGFLIQGILTDDGAPPETVRKVCDNLKIDNEGFVNVSFEYADRSGNLFRQNYRLNVTAGAVRRGADLMYYVHTSSPR
jgi:hypothetical protein